MSQQTLLKVVVPKFDAFVKICPDFDSLADVSEDQLRVLWAGLGYYARARNLVKGARYIQAMGTTPAAYEQWLSVPGCGPYTASVIASICFKEKVACVDGNVIRVVSRLTALGDRTWTSSGLKDIAKYVQESILLSDDPGDFNQAMMEIGATICKKQSPDCDNCPFQDICVARLTGTTAIHPPVKKRADFKITKIAALFVRDADKVLLIQRKSGFLKSTVGFPLVSEVDFSSTPMRGKAMAVPAEIKHSITNHKIQCKVLVTDQKDVVAWVQQHNKSTVSDLLWCTSEQLQSSLSSSLDRKVLDVYLNHRFVQPAVLGPI